MSLQTLSNQLGKGGVGIPDQIPAALKELQGFNVSVVAGAAAASKMNVAALRSEDTLASVLAFNAGVPAEDKANCTISATKAYGTVTVAAVNDADTATVNGVVYTFKDAPTALNHVKRTAGNNNANALALATAINTYERRYTSQGSRVAQVVAVANSAVVTITAVVDGAAGNSITLLSSNGTRLAVTGSGTLTNGSDTGGFTSTTNLTGQTVVVIWFNKR